SSAAPLLLLAFLAEDALGRVLDALALVGLRRPVIADFGGDLADFLAIAAADHDLDRPRRGDGDAVGDRIHDVVAVAERELQVLALYRGAIADAADLEPLFEAFAHAGDQVRDQRARGAPLRARALGFAARVDLDLAAFELHRHVVVQHDRQRAFRAFDLDGLAFGEQVLRGQEQLLDGGRHAALEEHGLPGAARGLEEGEVLHVAGADLNDVRHLGHVAHAFGVHRLGADQQPGFGARFGEQLEPRPAQPLKGVGRGARFPGPAAQDHRARVLDEPGGGDDLALVLDRTGPRDRDDLGAADRHAARQADDGVLGLPLAAHLLVRLGDVDD